MQVELEPADVETILEGLDYVKSRIAFKKGGGSYDDKTRRLAEVEAIEQKLRRAQAAG